MLRIFLRGILYALHSSLGPNADLIVSESAFILEIQHRWRQTINRAGGVQHNSFIGSWVLAGR